MELDSFYHKFKNLLLAEKDVTLILKSEAGKASVTLSLDLGPVLAGQGPLPPRGFRNGPARQRRREQRAAARAVKLAEEAKDNVESTEKVENATPIPVAEEATEAKKNESAEKAKDPNTLKGEPAGKAEVIEKKVDDEFCPDDLYEKDTKKFISVETQTLEVKKRNLEFYTLHYEDSD